MIDNWKTEEWKYKEITCLDKLYNVHSVHEEKDDEENKYQALKLFYSYLDSVMDKCLDLRQKKIVKLFLMGKSMPQICWIMHDIPVRGKDFSRSKSVGHTLVHIIPKKIGQYLRQNNLDLYIHIKELIQEK